jgi:hypothetical protein
VHRGGEKLRILRNPALGAHPVRKTPTKIQRISGQKFSGSLTDRGCHYRQFVVMGFYEERPPRHGHRTPSELAEDEILSSLHGDFCAMAAPPDETGSTGRSEDLASTGATPSRGQLKTQAEE